MKKGYTVTLTFPKTNKAYEDLPILSQGFKSSEVVGKDGKHAVQSCTIHVRSKQLVEDIINNDEDILAEIYAGATPYFEGLIKPYTTIGAYNNTLEDVSLEVLDYTELLHKYVFMDPSKLQTPIKLKDPDNAVLEKEWRNVSARTLVRDLFALTKITSKVALVDVEKIPDITLKYFTIRNGELMDDIIGKLLYELVCDYRFTPGKCTFFSTANQPGIRTISSFNNKFKITRDEVDHNGIEVEYPEYNAGRYQIYHESNRWDSAWWDSHANQKKTGFYYERDMHDVKPTKNTAFWDFSKLTDDISNAKAIAVTDVTATAELSDEKDVTYEAHVDSTDYNGGCVYVSYDGTFDMWCGKGWGFDYTCEGLVEYSRPRKIGRAVGDKPKKVRLEYMDSVAGAMAFTEALAARQQTVGYKYQFESREKLSPGYFYNIEEKYVIGASSTVRILSCSFNPTTGLYSYKAEGAGTVGTIEVEEMPNTGGTGGDLTSSHLIRLVTDRNSYLVEEEDTDIFIYVDGILAHKPNINPEWSLGGEIIATGVDNITLRKSDLKIGLNYVACSIIYDGEVYTGQIGIALSKADNRAIIEYRWGESPTEPPLFGGFWHYNKKPILENNKILGDFEGRLWEEQPPEPEEGKPFLWMRLSTDGGATWAYSRLTGVPSVDFSITPNEVSYSLSSRGVMLEETTLHVHLTRINTLKPCHWKVRPEGLTVSPSPVPPVDYSVTTSPDELVITLPRGFSGDTVEVYASVEGIPDTKSFKIIGVCNGAPKGEYWGAGYTLAQLNGMVTAPTGEPWYKGDHVVVTIEEKRDGKTISGPVPYVYQNAIPHWVPVDENTPNYSESMGDALADILKMPDTKLVEAAQYGFFGNLAANAAFIRMLIVEKLKVGEDGTGLYVEIGTLPPTNQPVYLVKYNDKVLFQVSPRNGNIFFGEPETDRLEAPKTGFMYDAATQELYSKDKNFRVTATGEVYGSFKKIVQFLPFTFNDSLDSTHPAIFTMFVPDGEVEYVKIMIIGQPYRTYSSTASTWGSETTSTDGPEKGWDYDISLVKSDALQSTATSDNGGHKHNITIPTAVEGTTATGTIASKKLSDSGWTSTETITATGTTDSETITATGTTDKADGPGSHSHGYSFSGSHSHGYSFSGSHSHSFSVSGSHSHDFTGVEHTHGLTTETKSTLVGGIHSHTVNIPEYSLSVTGSLNHSHSINLTHTHDINMGILEGTDPTGMLLYVDNGSGYGQPISIVSGNEVTVIMSANGWKNLKVTSTTLGRIQMQVMLKMKIDTY